MASTMSRVLIILLLGVVASEAKKTYHKQLCVVTEPACRVPYEDRPLEWRKRHNVLKSSKKRGHLKPVGHEEFAYLWDGEIPTFEEGKGMTPEEFWTKYYPTEPFILKGAAKKDPAFMNWQDDEYIDKHYGGFKAKAENKNEDRLTDYCNMYKLGDRVHCPSSVKPYEETFINISRFMKNYRKPEYDKYIITQMPDAMAQQVGVVPAWYCGSRHPKDREHGYNHNDGKTGIMKGRPWMTQLYESNLWINYNEGRNFSSSVIHYDMNHQMMCLYAGTKEWILWDSGKYSKDVPLWSEYLKTRNGQIIPPQGSDDSPIDPERVDLEAFPSFAKAKWRNTTMEAGDCMYLPAWQLHYVRSWNRNIAGMYMFQTGQRYDRENCKDFPTTSTPLNDFDILWNFPGAPNTAGYNQVKMGYPDWKKFTRESLTRFARNGKIQKRDFVAWLSQHLQGGGGEDEYDDDDSEYGGGAGHVERQANNIFAAVAGSSKAKAFDVDEVYRNPKLAELYRSIAVGQEGRADQELDTRLMQFDLTSNKKVVREEHEEL